VSTPLHIFQLISSSRSAVHLSLLTQPFSLTVPFHDFVVTFARARKSLKKIQEIIKKACGNKALKIIQMEVGKASMADIAAKVENDQQETARKPKLAQARWLLTKWFTPLFTRSMHPISWPGGCSKLLDEEMK
jgi:hypothetical protein